MKTRLLLGFLFCAAFPAIAQESAPSNNAPVTDPAAVREHYLSVLNQPEYQEPAEPNEQFRDWFSQWFKRLGEEFGPFEFPSEMSRFASLLMTLFVILAIAGLLYILVRLTRRKGESPALDSDDGAEFFASPAPRFYEEELRRALSQGDWRGAWLASWRQFLSRLEQSHLVEADRSQTNREYLAQLRGEPLPASALDLLDRMVDLYDRFIYGRRPVAEPDWDSFRQQVDEATLLLHLRDHTKT